MKIVVGRKYQHRGERKVVTILEIYRNLIKTTPCRTGCCNWSEEYFKKNFISLNKIYLGGE